MKRPTQIGKQKYDSKKAALAHYRMMLNSYEFGQPLNDDDYDAILDLLDYAYTNYTKNLEISGSELE